MFELKQLSAGCLAAQFCPLNGLLCCIINMLSFTQEVSFQLCLTGCQGPIMLMMESVRHPLNTI